MAGSRLPRLAAPDLRIRMVWSSPEQVRAILVGILDLSTVQLLRESLLGVLDGQSHLVVEVDLRGVSFLDCAGIGALVGARNVAVRSGCTVFVQHPRPFARRVLDLTGVSHVLCAPVAA
jgi:anti-anti-sigma factor